MSEAAATTEVALRRLFSVVNGATPDSQKPEFWNGEVTWVTPEDLSNRSSPDVSGSKRTLTRSGYESCGTSLVPAGSIVLSTRAPIGNLGVAATPLCTNQGCKSLVPLSAETNSRFFFYQLSVLSRELNRLGKGTTFLELSASELAAFKVAAPPPDQQERIANFLDEQTARIDALIAEKEELHTLLEEEKQACIDGALFAGLEPTNTFPFTPATQSVRGVTWSRCMLKHKWRVTDCKHLTVEFRDEGVPIASIREVSSGGLNLSTAKRASESDYRNLVEGGREPKRGDLIYARNASVGAAALVDTDEPFSMGQDVCLITSSSQDQAFLRLQLMSSPLKAQLESLLQGATIRRINVEQIRGFSVFVPPVSEQHKVVAEVGSALERRQVLQWHIEEHIERLREYRSSLISAAVTGKLDIGALNERPRLAA